jgi:hypothetical protein
VADDFDYVRRTDADHIALRHDVKFVKDKVVDLEQSHERIERQLIGVWDDNTHEWKPGLVQVLNDVQKSIESTSKRALAAALWIGGVLTALLTALLTTVITNHGWK